MKSILYVPASLDDHFKIDEIEIDGWFKATPTVLASGFPADVPIMALVPSRFIDSEFDVIARFRHPEKISNSGNGIVLKAGLVCNVPEEDFDKYASLCTKWNASKDTPETWRKAVEFAKKVIA